LTNNRHYNSFAESTGVFKLSLTILVLTGLVSQAFALNADSLGGTPWSAYLKSNTIDTANGPLYLNQVKWLGATADAGKMMMQLQNYGSGILGWQYSASAPFITGISASASQPWMEVRSDSAGPGLIKLHGNAAQTTPSNIILIDQLGQYSTGLAIFAQGTGIYVGSSGSGQGLRMVNSSTSSGIGISLDNLGNGTAMYVSDTKSGRMIVTSQDSANKPAITVGYKYGPTFRDSAMLYPWGLKSKKMVADTLWGRLAGTSDSAVISGRANLLRTGGEYQSGEKFLRTDKTDTARFVVFDSIKAGKIVDLNVATSTNSNYLLYGSSYQAGTSYLRSDAADTVSGQLWLNDVRHISSYTPVGGGYSQVWNNYGNQSVMAYNWNPVGQGIYAINKGVNDGQVSPYRSSYWLDMRSDSSGGMIRLDCNNRALEGMRILGVRHDWMGLAIYNATGNGIYIDHGGDQFGMRIENNYMSTGTGLHIDNQNTGTGLYVSDTKSGRMIVTSQDSANKPAITVGYKYGPTFRDSAMLYPWGLKSKKAAIDTIRTALSGRRYFGNQQKNTCDTFIVWGAAESTTVVTASYGKDTRATSWNGLQAWAGKDTVYVQRRAVSDPNNYYWRANKTIEAAQIQATPYNTGAEGPPETAEAITSAVKLEQSYPNPTASDVFISYQVAREGQVSLAVYNMLGQKVKTLVEQPQPAGAYKISWDGRNQQGQGVSSGIYFYELKTEDARITKKLVLAK
jgi:hypothetical protein